MTSLSAALEARDKATPGPLDIFLGNANGRGLIRIEASHLSPKAGRHIASMPRGEQSERDALRFSAAPDALDWIAKALPTIKARATQVEADVRHYTDKLNNDPDNDIVGEYLREANAELATLGALIAQAEGEKGGENE